MKFTSSFLSFFGFNTLLLLAGFMYLCWGVYLYIYFIYFQTISGVMYCSYRSQKHDRRDCVSVTYQHGAIGMTVFRLWIQIGRICIVRIMIFSTYNMVGLVCLFVFSKDYMNGFSFMTV